MILQKVFFTSDLHFGHENVLRFDNRPFASVEEMDAELVRRWNEKVGKGDLVYVLGDLIWKSRNGDAHNLIRSLNGQIILIKGNHDRFLHNAQAKAALAGIKDYDDICVTLEDGSVRRCILSHYFIPFYNGHRHRAARSGPRCRLQPPPYWCRPATAPAGCRQAPDRATCAVPARARSSAPHPEA